MKRPSFTTFTSVTGINWKSGVALGHSGHSQLAAGYQHVVHQGVREPGEDLIRAPAGGRVGRGQAHPLREASRVSAEFAMLRIQTP